MSRLQVRVNQVFEHARRHAVGTKEGLPAMMFLAFFGNDVKTFPITEPRSMWARVLREAMAEMPSDMYCLVSEAWYVKRDSTDDLDAIAPPSQQPDRRECIFVYGESPTEQYSRSADIIRDENGVITALDDTNSMGAIFDGRFTGFLYKPTPH